MSAPAFTVEVAFATTDPLTTSPTWTDVTAYLRSLSTRRGRNHELGRTSAGTATIVLDNLDRRFDPTNASGPYFGNLLPMKQVRIRTTSPTADVFRGFVEDWGQGWAGPAAATKGDATVTVQAVDGFKVLQLASVRNYRAEVLKDSPVVYVPFDDPAGTAAATNLGSAGGELFYGLQTAFPGRASSPMTNGARRSLDIADAATAHESRSLVVTGPTVCEFAPLSVEAWIYLDALPSDANASLAIFPANPLLDPGDIATNDVSITTTGHVQWHGPGQGTGSVLVSNGTLSLGAWHHVVCTADANWSGEADARSSGDAIYIDGAFDIAATVFALYTEGAGENTWWTTSTHSFDGAQAHLAFYDRVLPPERIAAHFAAVNIDTLDGASGTAVGEVLNAAGWPAGLRSIDTGSSTVSLVPDGVALDLLQVLAEDTEHGILTMGPDGSVVFIGRGTLANSLTPLATFGDGGGTEIPYSDLQLAYDDQDLWTETAITGADGAEVLVSDATALASFGRRTLSVSTVAATSTEVADQAQGLLNRYKAPAVRPSSMKLHGQRSATQQVTRAIGDRVTVKRRPPGGGTLSTDAIIEGIDHDLGPDGWPVSTFHLAPPDPASWVLADGTYGVLGTTTFLGW